jgi:hypothetical protein
MQSFSEMSIEELESLKTKVQTELNRKNIILLKEHLNKIIGRFGYKHLIIEVYHYDGEPVIILKDDNDNILRNDKLGDLGLDLYQFEDALEIDEDGLSLLYKNNEFTNGSFVRDENE